MTENYKNGKKWQKKPKYDKKDKKWQKMTKNGKKDTKWH